MKWNNKLFSIQSYILCGPNCRFLTWANYYYFFFQLSKINGNYFFTTSSVLGFHQHFAWAVVNIRCYVVQANKHGLFSVHAAPAPPKNWAYPFLCVPPVALFASFPKCFSYIKEHHLCFMNMKRWCWIKIVVPRNRKVQEAPFAHSISCIYSRDIE